MLVNDLWQAAMLEQLQLHLEPDGRVLAAVLLGSLAQANLKTDTWSDIDLLLVVDDDASENFYPVVGWLEAFGQLYTYEQSASDLGGVTRACFTDLRRVDFTIAPASKFRRVEKWKATKFWQAYKIVFSKVDWVEQLLSQEFPEPPLPNISPAQFERLSNSFWFKAVLAVNKVKRDDLLIALHLTLDLQRDCLLLAMWLRDRATGTTYHRNGGIFNQVINELNDKGFAYTPSGILSDIAHTAEVFDKLAAQWSPEYKARSQPLIEWVDFTLNSLNKPE